MMVTKAYNTELFMVTWEIDQKTVSIPIKHKKEWKNTEIADNTAEQTKQKNLNFLIFSLKFKL